MRGDCKICGNVVFCKGLCQCHYTELRLKIKDKKCEVVGCNNGHYAKGMCRNHYMQMDRKYKSAIKTLELKKDSILCLPSVSVC